MFFGSLILAFRKFFIYNQKCSLTSKRLRRFGLQFPIPGTNKFKGDDDNLKSRTSIKRDAWDTGRVNQPQNATRRSFMQRAPKAFRRALSLYFHRETDRVKGTYGHDTVNRRVAELNDRLAIGRHWYRYRSNTLDGKSTATPAE